MSDNTPKIGFNSIPFNAPKVIASSEQTDYPIEHAFDWVPGDLYKPAVDSNILSNGLMDKWTSGTSSPPDGWVLAGAAATAIQDTTNYRQFPASVKLTRNGTDCTLTQTISTYADYAGGYVSVIASVKTSIATTVSLIIDDGVGTSSVNHTGGGAFEYLRIVHLVDASASKLDVQLKIATNDGDAYMDAVKLVAGRWASGTPLGQQPNYPDYPEEAQVFIYPVTGQLLPNGWLMSDWTNGPTSAPDGWTLEGSGATVAQDEDDPVIDRMSVALTRNGADAYIKQSLDSETIENLKGKYFTVGAHVKATVASRGYIGITVEADSFDSGGVTITQVNDGDSDWDFDTLTWNSRPIPDDVTDITVFLAVLTGDTTVNFDGVIVVEGISATETPHNAPCDFFAAYAHNFGTAEQTVKLEYSDDNWSTSTELVSVSPTDDTALFETFTQVTKSAYRIVLEGGAGASVASVGCIAFGELIEIPSQTAEGIDILNRQPIHETVINGSGNFLGRATTYEQQQFQITLPVTSMSSIEGDISEWFEHAGTKGLPFFVVVQLDSTDYVRFVIAPNNYQFRAPVSRTVNQFIVKSYMIDCLGVAE